MIFRVGGSPWEDEGFAAALALLAHALSCTYPRRTFAYFGGGGTKAVLMQVRTLLWPFNSVGTNPAGQRLRVEAAGAGNSDEHTVAAIVSAVAAALRVVILWLRPHGVAIQ